LLEVIDSMRARGAFWLYAYVIMPDHVHFLLQPHNLELESVMRATKSISAMRIMRSRGKRGPLWQPRYFDNITRHVREFWEKLEYIHNNPVAAGLAERAEDWRWSSHAAYASVGVPPPIPVDKPTGLPTDGDALLWPAL
jgi:putative transposase